MKNNKENEKLISTITFCKRLGKLVLGFDLVKTAMQQGTAYLVMISTDLSPKTKKEIMYLATELETQTLEIDITLDELWYLIGKRAGVIAVCDEGFAEKILNATIAI